MFKNKYFIFINIIILIFGSITILFFNNITPFDIKNDKILLLIIYSTIYIIITYFFSIKKIIIQKKEFYILLLPIAILNILSIILAINNLEFSNDNIFDFSSINSCFMLLSDKYASESRFMLFSEIYFKCIVYSKPEIKIIFILSNFLIFLIIALLSYFKKDKQSNNNYYHILPIYSLNPFILFFLYSDNLLLVLPILIFLSILCINNKLKFLAWIPLAFASSISVMGFIISCFFIRKLHVYFIFILSFLFIPLLEPSYQDYIVKLLIDSDQIKNIINFFRIDTYLSITYILKSIVIFALFASIILVGSIQKIDFYTFFYILCILLAFLFPQNIKIILLIAFPIIIFEKKYSIIIISVIFSFYDFFEHSDLFVYISIIIAVILGRVLVLLESNFFKRFKILYLKRK